MPERPTTRPRPTPGNTATPLAQRGPAARPAPPAQHPSSDNRFKLIDRTLKRFQYQQDALIEVLHTAQEAFGFLADDLLLYIARQLKLPPSWVYGVATFYHFFSLKPQGEHSCIVCMGTACYVKQAAEILAALCKAHGIEAGQTTPDRRLSVNTARCLGSCGLAPVLVLDGETVGRATPHSALAQVQTLLATVKTEAAAMPQPITESEL
jgi:bidirectional [NiFe] hydrogenase diaphorase subunit